MSKGKVYFVGSGPGDFELITLKGYKLVSRADVILYEGIVSDKAGFVFFLPFGPASDSGRLMKRCSG